MTRAQQRLQDEGSRQKSKMRAKANKKANKKARQQTLSREGIQISEDASAEQTEYTGPKKYETGRREIER